MRLIILALLAGFAGSVFSQSETLGYWAQNDNELPGGGFGFQVGGFPQAADAGVDAGAALQLVDFVTAATDGIYDCIQSFAGTTSNALPGFAGGGSLSPQGCIDNGNNGMAIEISVDTTGYQDVVVSWAQRGTASGFTSRQFAWSDDGGASFNDLGSDQGALGSSWQIASYDLAGIESLADNSEVVFRITLDGATGATGNNRFDNIRVEASPLGNGPNPEPFACVDDPEDDDLVTRIHAIQGSGFESPLVGESVEVQAIVVGAFQGENEIGGFFLQEADANADENPLTSEGVYVSPASAAIALPDLAIGDEVRVAGTVRERFGQTELFSIVAFDHCGGDQLERVSSTELVLPVDDLVALEALEGMWVRLPQSLTVTEVFNAARFAEFAVATDRLFQPTQVVEPGAAANALQDLNDRSRLIIDQGLAGSYRTPYQPGLDGTPLNAGNPIRVGYRIQADFNGIMGFGFSNYRLFALETATFDEADSARPESPPELPEGNLRVGSLNVENLFTTLQDGGAVCGPNELSCRGASSASELERQRDKLVSSITALDADVLGLIEVENDADDSTLQFLVDAINAAGPADDWTFIATGYKGTDAIKNAIIYRTSRVSPVGDIAILDSSVDVDPPFDDSRQRPVLMQAFELVENGEVFSKAVMHLRSKNCGSNASGANADQGDGQGCWNALRTQSVASFRAWMQTDPTGTGTTRHLVVGDFNAYAQEDPLQVLVEEGYVNQAIRANDDDPAVYSYVFMGQSGSLDHVLASPAMNDRVLGAANWAVNADEIPAFAYPETLPASSLPKPANFYQPNAFRSSDHDPLVISVLIEPVEDELFSDRFEQE